MVENQGEWLLNEVSKQLQSEWQEYRRIYANSKGATYEESFSDLLGSYFGGVYEINTRVAPIDPKLRCFDIFDFQSGNDELDIVALFQNSKPRIIFETGEGAGKLKWVPYEGVAFICEVKSSLQKQKLSDDLKKLEQVSKLDDTINQRFGAYGKGEFTSKDPTKCLVYNEESIADDTLERLLSENMEAWDMLLIVEDDLLILNTQLPFADLFVPSSEHFVQSTGISQKDLLQSIEHVNEHPEYEDIPELDVDPNVVTVSDGLLWFLIAISATIPDPYTVNTANSFLALTEGRRFNTGAKTKTGKDTSE